MLIKPHARSRRTSYLRKSFVSKPRWGGLIALLRLRIVSAAIRFIIPTIIPVIRRDHAKDILSIIACVPNENINPPIPEPAVPIPFARLRFLSNHWGRVDILGIDTKPTPKPTRTPWLRKSCQISWANDAEMKPAEMSMAPVIIGIWVPHLRAMIVTMGATSMAEEKLRPPMKAKSMSDAPENTLFAR